MPRACPLSRLLGATLFVLVTPWGAPAQERPELRIASGEGELRVSLVTGRGFAALPVSSLASLGWEVGRTPMGALLRGPGGAEVEIRDGTPFVRWDDGLIQLADAPYFESGELHVPLQLVLDVLPHRVPGSYTADPATLLVTRTGGGRAAAAPAAPRPPPAGDQRRMVIIDAGHGGEDPGTISRSGVREKNVALGIALAMAEALSSRDDLEVVLLRSDDTFIPVWDRGAIATERKGERTGIFVSIHANSAASTSSTARGFETYFLSEARTEHERRVAAIENAPLGVEASADPSGGDLDYILRELKNLDQQHWSSLMAEMVQRELAGIHPGPNRGVKQSPLAVLTNAIMPAVLVEIGYLSHPDEARLLNTSAFQKDAGQAIARAVEQFFERYPPGNAGGGAGEGP